MQIILEIKMDEILQKNIDLLNSLCPSFESAFKIHCDNISSEEKIYSIPNLKCFYAQTLDDIYVQNFNINMTLPNVFEKDDDIVSWLEGMQTLRRDHVAYFFTKVENQRLLDILSFRICQSENGSKFMDGLKLFIPLCGILCLPPSDISRREALMTSFCRAHLSVSSNPIIPGAVISLSLIMHLCTWIVNVIESLENEKNRSQQSSAVSDFIESVKKFDPKSNINDSYMFSLADLTDIYYEVTNWKDILQYMSMKSSSSIEKSFLLSHYDIIGWSRCCFNLSDQRELYWTIVTTNSIYFFDNTFSYCSINNQIHLIACIPLYNTMVSLNHDEIHSHCINTNVCTIEFSPIEGDLLSWIQFDIIQLSNDGLSQFIPKEITYHKNIIMDVGYLDTKKEDNNNRNSGLEWFDIIASNCWKSNVEIS
jgi:hypothetical protein